MFTRTTKTVLSPLAETVSSLIVIISEAELGGRPTPDLSQLSVAVDAQVAALLRVAEKTMTMPSADDELKANMPAACSEVTAASKGLLASTTELAKDPHSSVGRAQLLEAVKGILSGTSRVLDVHDDFEVRKILAASRLFRQLLAKLCDSPPPANATATGAQNKAHQDAYIQLVSHTSQAVFVLAQLSTKRVAEILSDIMQLQLQDAIRIVTRDSPLLVSACKVLLTTSDVATARMAMSGVCGRLEQASLRIDEVVQWKENDAVSPSKKEQSDVTSLASRQRQLGKDVRASGDLLKALADRPQATKALYSDYIEVSRQRLAELENTIPSISDPTSREFAERVVRETRENLDRLAKIAIDGYREPGATDTQINAEAAALVDAISAGHDALETATGRGLVSELIVALGTLSDVERPGTVIANLSTAAKSQDGPGAKSSGQSFESANDRLDKLVQHTLAVTATTNPQLHKELDMQHSRLKGLHPAVTIATALFEGNPNDKLVQEHLNAVIGSYVDTAKDLRKAVVAQEGVFSANDLVAGGRLAFDQQVHALRAAISRGDHDTVRARLVDAQIASEQLTAIIEKERDNTEDAAYKSELAIKLKSVQDVLPQLLTASQVSLSSSKGGPVDDAGLAGLDAIIAGLALHLSQLGATVQSYKGGKLDTLQAPASVPTTAAVVAAEAAAEAEAKSKKDADAASSLEAKMDALQVSNADSKRSSHVPHIEDDALRALAQAVTETVFVDAEAPRLLTQEEAVQEPLKAVGQELKVEAAFWSSEDNPVITAVTNISTHLLALSTHHSELSRTSHNASAKRSFIQAAQGILTDTENLIKAAQSLVKACTDRRLRQQLENTLDLIRSLAQQLKIVAAVKASSPGDSDRDVQLVSCAQNLMQSVKMALRNCVSCSLRIRKGDEGLAAPAVGSNGTVRFRKAVYSRGLLGSQ